LPDFSISPVSGYISPGMDVTFEVLFHPLDINSDIRYEVSFGVTFSLIIIFHNIEDKINRLVCLYAVNNLFSTETKMYD